MAYTVLDNTPSAGYVSWAGVHIVYQGIDHTIIDGNTNLNYVWWDYDFPTVFQVTDTFPTMTDDDVLVFFNKDGTHLTVPKATVIDGGLIVPESILADAIAANAITSQKVMAGAISATHIAADAVGANAIAAGAVVTDKIYAGAVTTAKIAAGAVTANEVAAGAVTTEKLHVLARNLVNNFSITNTLTGWYNSGAGTLENVTKDGVTVRALKLTTTNHIYALSDKFYVDPTQTYKVTLSILGDPVDSTTGTRYFGFNAFSSDSYELYVIPWYVNTKTWGTSTNTPCFWNGDIPANTWRDMTAYILGCNVAVNEVPLPKNIDSCFKMPSNTTQCSIVFWNYYNADVSITNHFFSPSVTQVDDGQVYAEQIVANSITAGQIAAGAIGTDELAANSVIAGKVAANAIGAAAIAAGAVTTDKLDAQAVTAVKIAAGAVITDKLDAGAVTTAKIAAGAVTANEVAANSITAGQIAAGAIGTDELAANSVIAGKVAADAIGAAAIAAGAVTTDKLDAGAVTAVKIAAGSIATEHISAGGIVADKIIGGELNTLKLDVVAPDALMRMKGDGLRAYDQAGQLVGHFGWYETLADQIATFSRASTAYDSFGISYASGVPRYEYTRQPAPVWSDLFDTDQLASEYTKYEEAAGTYTVSGGILSVTTGAGRSFLIKNDLLLQDCELEINSDQMQDGGIAARWQDINNHYVLVLSDDSGANPGSNLIINKRVSGTYTQIASANVTWARGTSKPVKFTVHGSRLEAWFDGVKVISITDTTFTGGSVGPRSGSNVSTANRFLDFKVYHADQAVMAEEACTNIVASWPTGWTVGGDAGMTAVDQGVQPGAALNTVRLTNSGATEGLYNSPLFALSPSTTYTWRIKARGTVGTGKFDVYVLSNTGTLVQSQQDGVSLTGVFQVFTNTFTTTADITGTNQYIRFDHNGNDAGYIEIAEVALIQKAYPLSFPGYGATRAAEVLTIPTAGVFNEAAWTVDLLFAPTSNQVVSGRWARLWQINKGGATRNEYNIIVTQEGKIALEAIKEDIIYSTATTYAVTPGNAYSIQAVGNGSTGYLRINGVEVGTFTYQQPTGTLPANMYIGCDIYGSIQANGLIDDFRVSNIARTLAEHQAAYNSGLPLAADEHTTILMSIDGTLQPTVRRFGLWSKNGEITLDDPPVEGGIRVYDNTGELRTHIGQYAAGKYGLKVNNGEIYSTTIRTGAETDTTYVALVPPNELVVKYLGKTSVSIVTGGYNGQIVVWDWDGYVNEEKARLDGYYGGLAGTEGPGLIANTGKNINLSGQRVGIKIGTGGFMLIKGEHRVDGVSKHAGDILPWSDNSYKLGDSGLRFSEIHATLTYFGDVIFTDKTCPLCGGLFATGDVINLLVVSSDDSHGNVTLPVHSKCAESYNGDVLVSVPDLEKQYRLKDDGTVEEVYVQKYEQVVATKYELVDDVIFNKYTGEFIDTKTNQSINRGTALKSVSVTRNVPVRKTVTIKIGGTPPIS